MAKISPGMEQYLNIKKDYEDCILFYRLGDFYEMFFDDALVASRELELTLTSKNCGLEDKAPMCGVPFHAADTYIARMVEKGYKVAVCEQMEDPATAKGIVKREVIRVVTPGTITSQNVLDEKHNNYIASIAALDDRISVSYSDISTGELCLTEFGGDDLLQILSNELVKISPSEIIISQSFSDTFGTEEINYACGAYIDVLPETYFSVKMCEEKIAAQFKGRSLASLGLDFRPAAVLSLGVLLSYLFETQKQELNNIIDLSVYEVGQTMALDKAAIRNLEITETLFERTVKGSLLGVLDKTKTAMGSRLMSKWLREPLNDVGFVNKRLDGVEELYDEFILRNDLRELLNKVYDFERLSGRIALGTANGKDMIALMQSLSALPDIKSILSSMNSDILQEIHDNINTLDNIYKLISDAIVEDPPFTIKDGGIIKKGYSDKLDELKLSIKDGKEWISTLETKEKERTGLKTLKVGYNKVFGYYIEVSKSLADKVPEEYIRKQTLVGGERFITPELKEMESLVLNAEAKINETEYNIFTEIRNYIQGYISEIQRTSKAIAKLDVLLSFAYISEKNGYIKPVVDNSFELEIIGGRHPVIEQTVENGLFVSNDTYVNSSDCSMLLITGPNMSGKSTYMRQTALIVLMAQAGCFVPCEKARIGICDRIFTRIGASDNLARGQSTFYVEMSELSYIINNAKERSLIILDEIGRGTSTYDGLSIAWATVEYLCNKNSHIRTLFATHYHELTALESQLYGVKNLNVDVKESNGNVVFLHKICPGPASRSYGIHVAKLAGIPNSLLERADDVLRNLEEGKSNEVRVEKPKEKEAQLSLFDLTPDPIISMLRNLNLMEITPGKAITILEELKSKL